MFDLSRILRIRYQEYLDKALMTAFSTTTTVNREEVIIWNTQQGLAAADLILPQPVLLCLKFSLDGEERVFAVYGVLGTIASFILDGH